MDVAMLFTLLGPAFLLLGAWRWSRGVHARPQAGTWLLVGSLFSLVAAWLRWAAPGG
jgi:uncharacterized membrane protein HdeD (DUF308 family)